MKYLILTHSFLNRRLCSQYKIYETQKISIIFHKLGQYLKVKEMKSRKTFTLLTGWMFTLQQMQLINIP